VPDAGCCPFPTRRLDTSQPSSHLGGQFPYGGWRTQLTVISEFSGRYQVIDSGVKEKDGKRISPDGHGMVDRSSMSMADEIAIGI
jgi:hypothetical protein